MSRANGGGQSVKRVLPLKFREPWFSAGTRFCTCPVLYLSFLFFRRAFYIGRTQPVLFSAGGPGRSQSFSPQVSYVARWTFSLCFVARLCSLWLFHGAVVSVFHALGPSFDAQRDGREPRSLPPTCLRQPAPRWGGVRVTPGAFVRGLGQAGRSCSRCGPRARISHILVGGRRAGSANYVLVQLPVPLGRPTRDDALPCHVPSAHRRWHGPRAPAQCWAGRRGLPTRRYCLCPGALPARGARAAHRTSRPSCLCRQTPRAPAASYRRLFSSEQPLPQFVPALCPRGCPEPFRCVAEATTLGLRGLDGGWGCSEGGRPPFLLLSTVSGLIVSSVDFRPGERF